MMRRAGIWSIAISAASVAVLAELSAQDNKNDARSVLTYTKDVFPIIRANCLPCHLKENENPSGLALDNFETMMKGGEHGTPVIPGKPKESYLYLKLLPNPPFGKQMARSRRKLSEEEIKTIYDWIEQGAKEK